MNVFTKLQLSRNEHPTQLQLGEHILRTLFGFFPKKSKICGVKMENKRKKNILQLIENNDGTKGWFCHSGGEPLTSLVTEQMKTGPAVTRNQR